jgi:hypothetical protein
MQNIISQMTPVPSRLPVYFSAIRASPIRFPVVIVNFERRHRSFQTLLRIPSEF